LYKTSIGAIVDEDGEIITDYQLSPIIISDNFTVLINYSNMFESLNDWTLCVQSRQQIAIVYIAFGVISHLYGIC